MAVPDISAITLPPGEYARFILATDGVWDVLTESNVMNIVSGERNPIHAAKQLSRIAFQKRMSTGTRHDDITVCVIDINAQHNVQESFRSHCLSHCIIS